MTRDDIEAWGFRYNTTKDFNKSGEKVTYMYFTSTYITKTSPIIRMCDRLVTISAFGLIYCPTWDSLEIQLKDSQTQDYACYYNGSCKDEEEFKTILKLLQVDAI